MGDSHWHLLGLETKPAQERLLRIEVASPCSIVEFPGGLRESMGPLASFRMARCGQSWFHPAGRRLPLGVGTVKDRPEPGSACRSADSF